MSGPAYAVGIRRLLALEWARLHAGWQNTLSSRDRDSRTRASTALLVAALVLGGGGWVVLHLLGGRTAPSTLLTDADLAVVTFAVVMLALDGVRRAVERNGEGWEGRFEREWLVVRGVAPRALAVRSVIRALGPTLMGIRVPLIVLIPALSPMRLGDRLGVAALILGIALGGFALGTLGESAGRPVSILARVLACGLGIWSFALMALMDTPGHWVALLRRPLGAWHALLHGGPLPWGVGLTGVLAAWVAARYAAVRRPASVVAPASQRTGLARVTSVRPLAALLQRDRQTLLGWTRRDWMVVAYTLVAPLGFFATLSFQSVDLISAFTGSGHIVWLALWFSALPSLALSEALWSREGVGPWIVTRLGLRDPSLALRSRSLSTGGGLALFHLLATLALAFTPAARPSLARYLAVGLIMALALGPVSALGGAASLRLSGAVGPMGRLTRYAALLAAVVLMTVALVLGGIPLALGGAVLLAVPSMTLSARLLSRTEFRVPSRSL